MSVSRIAIVVVALFMQSCASLELGKIVDSFVLIHPPYSESYRCSEHREGQLPYLGDSLGADCTIGRLVNMDGRLWVRSYNGDGHRNEDWFGYGADVLAPCRCSVSRVRVNKVENEPGILGKPPSSSITFVRPDGAHILIAHVQGVHVSEGEKVVAGQVVASVGNNGYSRQPHLHIGAWIDEQALQIRFDQSKISPIVIETK